MNRSKMITATALATVMTAGAAQAEMSIGGLYFGSIYDNSGAATSHAESTNSIYVSYSDSLDNGMGLSVAVSMSKGGANKTDVNIDTGFGTLGLGDGQDSAVDAMDGGFHSSSLLWGPRFHTATDTVGFNDGDTDSGNSIAYTSPSINGFTIKATRGFDDGITDATNSVAVSGSVMGVSIAAGVSSIDRKDNGAERNAITGIGKDQDPSFIAVGYSIAGLNLGYAVYDEDDSATNGEETAMGVGTTIMGMGVGATFSERDTNTVDTDYTLFSITKSMGAADFGVDYLETDPSNAASSDTISFTYSVGF